MPEGSTLFGRDLDWTLDHEGGVSNHPRDPGKFTFRGVSKEKHPNETALWTRLTHVLDTSGKQAALEDPEINKHIGNFYWDRYYNPLGCPKIAAPLIRRKLFDTAVNVGRRRAARWLQRTLNLADRGSDQFGLVLDGGIGNVTLGVLNKYLKEDLFLTKTFTGFQLTHYQTLCERASRFESFLRGWTNRAFGGVLGIMTAEDHGLADVVTEEDMTASLITGDSVASSLQPAWG